MTFEIRVPGLKEVQEKMERVRTLVEELDKELSYINSCMYYIRAKVVDRDETDSENQSVDK